MMTLTENNTKMKTDETKTYRYSKKKAEKKSGMNCRPCKKCVIKWQSQKENFFEVQETGCKLVKGEKITWNMLEEKENTM